MGDQHTATDTGVSIPYCLDSTLSLDRGVVCSPLSIVLWTTVLAASALDIVTTAVGLAGGLAEGNALARATIEVLGISGLAGLKLGALAVLATTWYLLDERQGHAALAGFGCVTMIVAAINGFTIATA